MPDDRTFRRDFFRSLHEEPLTPDDPRYLPLYEPLSDVILHLKETITFSEGRSTQLLSGYRGAGKSTELRCLQSLLHEEGGYVVTLFDIEDYIDLHSPIDITTFLLALCAAIDDYISKDNLIPIQYQKESIFQRIQRLFQADVKIPEISASVGVAAVKIELKSNALFRQQVQEALAHSIGQFTREVREFFRACAASIRTHNAQDDLVILVDSIEHARGTNETEAEVHAALERLFADHDDKLKLPDVHLVYTVPPWLRIRRPNIGAPYSGAGLYTLPAQKVRMYTPGVMNGEEYTAGIQRLTELVDRRGDWRKLLGDEDALKELILATGGHLRDLIRILGTVAIEARDLPASPETRQSALGRLRAQFTPIPDDDARWLADIAHSRKAELGTLGKVGTLARYFDSHLVLCYQNGEEWFDVHPIVRDIVLEQAKSLKPSPTHEQ